MAGERVTVRGGVAVVLLVLLRLAQVDAHVKGKTMHIETIKPSEKLSMELGGTGYALPMQPATKAELLADAAEALQRFPELNMTVWKVLRSSVNWKRWAATRRLLVNHRAIPGTVLGSGSVWWFVSVDARLVVERLT